jgi:hypothetical protein
MPVKLLGATPIHGEVHAGDAHGPAHYGWIVAELVIPEVIPQNHRGSTAGSRGLLRQKAATECGLYAKCGKKVVTHQHAHAHVGNFVPGAGHAERGKLKSHQAVEGRGASAQVAIVRIGDPPSFLAGTGRADIHHFAWISHRQRTQNKGIGQAENRRVGANTQRQ